MLSRRNIRIKVMQMLYSMSRDPQLSFEDVLERYREGIQTSYELYLFNMYHLLKITEYAKKDAERRKAKHLPSEEDKLFTAKLFDNELVQSIFGQITYKHLVQKYGFAEIVDIDNIRKFYIEFAKGDAYKKYVREASTNAEHKQILLQLYKFCTSDEFFNELIEDTYANWVDDKSLVIGTVKKSIKALPADFGFFRNYEPTAETTVDFGEELIRQVCTRNEEFFELIEPTLKNWDADRVAVMDMILLKMALCELLIFPTIPTKVTLNEFVEISKLYSTEKSKDFINGILDRLMKKLNKEGKIKKEGRGLLE
ncbi:MAG: transcription antitermination factor NusB [Bacteroidota bacterium]